MAALDGGPGLVTDRVTGSSVARGDQLMCLAGLQSIPTDYYAAAKVDGASVWQRFRWIFLPLMSK